MVQLVIKHHPVKIKRFLGSISNCSLPELSSLIQLSTIGEAEQHLQNFRILHQHTKIICV